MKPLKYILSTSGLVCFTCLSLHCGDVTDVTDEDVSVVENNNADVLRTVSMYQNTQIAYQLEWSWQDAVLLESGEYQFANDLGYTFRVQSMQVTTGALELIPCESASRSGWSISLFTNALADHSADQDTSRAVRTLSEGITDRSPTPYANAPSSGQAYCQLHMLLAPGLGESSQKYNMESLSLRVAGSYRMPTGGDFVPFEVTINLKNGGMNPLRGVCNKTLPHPKVRVFRRPALAFDGLQPDKLVSFDFAYKIALRLASTLDVVVETPGTCT